MTLRCVLHYHCQCCRDVANTDQHRRLSTSWLTAQTADCSWRADGKTQLAVCVGPFELVQLGMSQKANDTALTTCLMYSLKSSSRVFSHLLNLASLARADPSRCF